MTDLELLFLVLGIIYVWECGCWVKREAIGFRTWLGFRWKATRPGRLLGNQGGGLLFSHPLPPLGTLLAGNAWPLSLNAEAVLAYTPPAIDPVSRGPQTANFAMFSQIQKIEANGKKVCVDGQLLLRGASPTFSQHIAETLRAIKQTPGPQRPLAIEKLIKGTFDVKRIQERWEQFRKETASLRFMVNLLFVYVFLAAPALIWQAGLGTSWKWLVVGLLLCTSIIASCFHKAHKCLYPGAEDERFTNSLIVLLSPASAIRAHDLLARPLLERFHPVAIARAFCRDSDFEGIAEVFLRQLRYPSLPLCPRPEPAAQGAESFTRKLTRDALEAFLRKHSIDADKLVKFSAPSDPGCRSFCPRCQAQFTATTGTCQDCGGIELIPFKAESARPASS